MSIEVTFVDAASGEEFARTVLDPEQLPETFAIETTLHIGDDPWQVVASEPVSRGAIVREGRLRLTLRRQRQVTALDPRQVKFGMPTICDPLPPADPTVSLADLELFVINEDLWRDVEWVGRWHARDIEANFAEIGAIRAESPGPFDRLHLRSSPPVSLQGAGLTVGDVSQALGPAAERLDGVVIDTMGAGYVREGFAFRLTEDPGAHVYGFCDGGEVVVLALHRDGDREATPAALGGLMDLTRRADADLVVWRYCDRLTEDGALDAWYRSGLACTKLPWRQ